MKPCKEMGTLPEGGGGGLGVPRQPPAQLACTTTSLGTDCRVPLRSTGAGDRQVCTVPAPHFLTATLAKSLSEPPSLTGKPRRDNACLRASVKAHG